MKIKKLAFTIAEVLLATVIVGIIAGIVLPTTIIKAQNKGFDQAYERNVRAISNAVDSLLILENKDFFKTVMYSNSDSDIIYGYTSRPFIKKYMKVSVYCHTDAKRCFADKYYQYTGNKREVYTPEYKGACAILQNGASICLVPQIKDQPIHGIIDLNGKKGPNVLDRDLREFTLDTKKYNTERDKTTSTASVTVAPDLDMSTGP